MRYDPLSPTGRVDGDDAFVAGDEAFTALNARAGGGVGRLLGVPQLATVARLARRLGIPVARSITIADGDADIDCWVRAKPGDGGVTITLGDMRARAPALPHADAPALAPPGAEWAFETDAALRLRQLPVNAAARHGFDTAALTGRSLDRLAALEPDDDGAMPLVEALAERVDFAGQRATLRADGTRVRLDGTARRDRLGGFAGFVIGVTAHVGQGSEPPLSADLAQRLERALRAPLERIVAGADSMNAEADGPLAAHYVDYAADIASAGRHLIALIDDMVDLDAIERDDFAVETEEVDLADVARRAAGLLSVRAADAGVAIDRPAAGEALPARGEFRRLLQVLVNLVANAVRYSPRGARIWVRVQQDGDRAVAIVADQGRGIAAEDQARIFEKFARVDPSEAEGSGLGLYIARRLARAMGGDLTVDSAPGQGARFILSVPAG